MALYNLQFMNVQRITIERDDFTFDKEQQEKGDKTRCLILKIKHEDQGVTCFSRINFFYDGEETESILDVEREE